MKWSVLLIVWTSFYGTTTFARSGLFNVTQGRNVTTRDKRFLIYERFAQREFIVGVAVPVELYDKKPWRSLAGVYVFHAQYRLPTMPSYPWDKWNGRSLQDAKLQYDKYGTHAPDESQIYAYSLIEALSSGNNGKKCLLRAICENAVVDETDGVWSAIINRLLTPSKDSPEEYRDAYAAGRYGMVCTSMYPECPVGEGLLDKISYVKKV